MRLNIIKNLKALLVLVLASTTLILILVQKGIAVFNTPGANSNAVKELVFAGMLLASRDIYHGIEWIQTQKENENIAKDVGKQKKKYAGHELTGKSLGVIGCGAIGGSSCQSCITIWNESIWI